MQRYHVSHVILVICLSFIPVVIVIGQNAYIIVNSVSEQQKIDSGQDVLTFAIKLTAVMDKIQDERNVSITYLSNNNNLTLEEPNGQNLEESLKEAYKATDITLEKIPSNEWVTRSKEFKMNNKLNSYLQKHRQNLEQGDSIESEFSFYNEINEDLAQQIAQQLRTVNVDNWLDFVSLRMLTDGKEWASRSLVLANTHFRNGAKIFLNFIKRSKLSSSFTTAAANVSAEPAESYHQYIQDTMFKIRQEDGGNFRWELPTHDYTAFLRRLEDDLIKRTQQSLTNRREVEGKRIGMAYTAVIISLVALLVVVAVAKEVNGKAKPKPSDTVETKELLSKAKGDASDLKVTPKLKDYLDVLEINGHPHRVSGRSSDLEVIPEAKEYKDETEVNECTDEVKKDDDYTQNEGVTFYVGH